MGRLEPARDTKIVLLLGASSGRQYAGGKCKRREQRTHGRSPEEGASMRVFTPGQGPYCGRAASNPQAETLAQVGEIFSSERRFCRTSAVWMPAAAVRNA